MKIRYKKPPIVERIIGVYREIHQEDFDANMPSWVERIKKDYPIAEPIAEWIIDVKQRNGVPLVVDAQPKARIIHLFWKRRTNNHRVLGMRIRPDRLVFHLRREEENPHDFDELLPEMERWIGPWAEHFKVKSFDGITLEYVNLLNHRITPQFSAGHGIQIGKALTMFGSIPGHYKGITQPYDCRIRLVMDEMKPCFFDLRVRAEDLAHEGVRIEFMINTRSPAQKSIDQVQALEEIRMAR